MIYTIKRILILTLVVLFSSVILSTKLYCDDTTGVEYTKPGTHFGNISFFLNATIGLGYYKGYNYPLSLPAGLQIDTAGGGFPSMLNILYGVQYKPIGIMVTHDFIGTLGQGLRYQKNPSYGSTNLSFSFSFYKKHTLSDFRPLLGYKWFKEDLEILRSEDLALLYKTERSYRDYSVGIMYNGTPFNKLYANIIISKEVENTRGMEVGILTGFGLSNSAKSKLKRNAFYYYHAGLSMKGRYVDGYFKYLMLSLNVGFF